MIGALFGAISIAAQVAVGCVQLAFGATKLAYKGAKTGVKLFKKGKRLGRGVVKVIQESRNMAKRNIPSSPIQKSYLFNTQKINEESNTKLSKNSNTSKGSWLRTSNFFNKKSK